MVKATNGNKFLLINLVRMYLCSLVLRVLQEVIDRLDRANKSFFLRIKSGDQIADFPRLRG